MGTVSFGFQSRARRTTLERVLPRRFDDQFDATLDGNWMWQVWDPSAPPPAAGERRKPLLRVYMHGSDIIGRLFRNGIHTVRELEIAETLAGMRPENVPPVDAFGIRFLFPNQVGDIIEGKSLTARLADPADADKLADLWDQVKDLDRNNAAPPEWIAEARKIKLLITMQPTNIDDLVDWDLVQYDQDRLEAAATAAQEAKDAVEA